MMNVKQNLVRMVESVLICSRVSTATVLGLDTLEATVKSQVCKPMTNPLPRWLHSFMYCITVKPNGTGPVILQPPDNTTKPLFEAVNLTCAADGYPPPVFQWYRDGVLIPNAVQSFYYIDQLTPDLRGYYTCEAINNQDDVTSSPGLVTIQSEFNTLLLLFFFYFSP